MEPDREPISDEQRERVVEAGAEIAKELGIPSKTADLASFYVGVAVGQQLQSIAQDHPALPPSEMRKLVRDLINRGMFGMTQAVRAYLDQPEDGLTH